MATPYISMAGIGKSFGPVHALKSVNLTVYPGEIHALLGENGAGKSTLMKVLSGIHEPTKGTITINNINYNKLDHKLAAQLGIGIIYQELSVIDELTVLENLYIGRHLTKKICGVNIIDWREMRVRAAMMLLRVGLKVDLDEKVANLSISHKQMLEIAKTLMLDAKVIIMDEPTSSLTNKEVDYLFLIMNQLRKEGTAIVYISHKLAEIRRICDRYTVMKDGNSVCSGMVSDVSNDDIVRLMVGRELQNRFNAMKENVSNLAHDTVFEVRNVTSRDRKKVRDISFSVCRGEILGFAGQPFIPEMLDKLAELKAWREREGLEFEIEVDGSCNQATYQKLMAAGADVFIVGTSGLFNHAENIDEAWRIMTAQILAAKSEVQPHAKTA